MKRLVSSFLVASILVTSIPVWADDVPVPPTVSPLQKGQSAPYTGVLLSPEAVASVIAQKDTADKTLQLTVQHQVDLGAVQSRFQIDTLTTTCTADKTILQAQVDDGKKQVSILTNQLKQTSGGPGAPVWIGLGAVGGVVLSLLTVFVVSRSTK